MQLGELICMNGFETDANFSAERLTITKPRPELGLMSPFDFDLSNVSPEAETAGYLAPHAISYCKGWTRSHCCVLVMHLAYEHPKFFEARCDMNNLCIAIKEHTDTFPKIRSIFLSKFSKYCFGFCSCRNQ